MNGVGAEERMRGRGGSGIGFLDEEDEGVGCAALETALVDLDRALVRDRCHAVVSAPRGPGRRRLLDALAERLAGPLEVVIIDPSLLEGDELCSRILDALRERSEVDPEMRLLSVLQGLGARGSALALLIDDAGSLPASTLRRLGRLAALSRPDLRLALVVVSESSVGSDLAQVVGALGVSAEKVVLGSRPGEGAGRPNRPAARPRPPELPQGPEARAHEERALEAMRLARRTGSAPVRSLAAVGLGLILALLGANHVAFQKLDPLAPEAPLALPTQTFPVEPMLARVASAVEDPVVPAELTGPGMRLEAAALEAAEPEAPAPVSMAPAAGARPRPQALAPQVPAPALRPQAQVAAAAPTRRVPVSVNARPWARIEVDGREVGVTPLGDVPLEPGPHRFRAHLPDGRVVERTTEVDPRRDHVVFP